MTDTSALKNNSTFNVQYLPLLPSVPGRIGEGGRRKNGWFKESRADRPLVSVVTVVRNSVGCLRETIESVLNKKYDNVEYILIDGGSTDGTLEIIKEYEERIDYWVSEPDSGIYDAMNKGIVCSAGKYVLFLNAMDKLLVDFSNILDELKHDFVLIYGKTNMLDRHHRPVYVKGKRLKDIGKIIRGTPLCHQSILYRRDVLRSYDLSYRVMADRVLTYEMLREHGLSRTVFVDMVFADYFEEGFSSRNFDVWRKEEVMFLKSIGRYAYAEYKRLGWLWKKIKRFGNDR